MRTGNEKRRGPATGLAAAAVGCLAFGMVGVLGSAPASAATLDLRFSCTFPIVGVQDVKTSLTIPIPEVIEVGQATGELPIEAVSTINASTVRGMNLVGGKTIEGAGTSTANITAPRTDLDPRIPVELEKTNVPASGEMRIRAAGSSPSLTFQEEGDIVVTVTGLALGPMTLKDAAGVPIQLETGSDTFNAPCTIPAGQETVLARGKVVPKGGGPTPT
ncbi:DUF6801 domain-containing protein, partial [Actinocorallia sp. B10E7]|uniref:DUF6801 domain-containing protein n=1 Tax=Actinocorallia sp. B10E7 TaxID=3153558 RepID=UPI00325F2DEE